MCGQNNQIKTFFFIEQNVYLYDLYLQVIQISKWDVV